MSTSQPLTEAALDTDKLQSLLRHRAAGSVSLIMPTHRAGAEKREDPIRLRNLLKQIVEDLQATGRPEEEAAARAEALRGAVDASGVWERPLDGLAAYAFQEAATVLPVPLAAPELATVGSAYHLVPLLPLLDDDATFYVLALSERRVRLLRGTRYARQAVELPEAPSNFAQILRFDVSEKHLQFHTGAGGRPTTEKRREAVFHGQGVGTDAMIEKRRLAEYCRKIDDALAPVLRDSHAPLLLAAADPLTGVFREATSYPHFVDQYIHGNPEQMSDQRLHQQALDILEPQLAKAREGELRHFRRLAEQGRTSETLEDILPAARHGRIETLYLADGEHRWGHFQEQRGQLETLDGYQPGADDLLNLAALWTLRTDGRVHVVPAEEVPGGGPLVAAFRFTA